ncbi:MAG: hypothetical protein KGN02_13000 [bacterium]|nr:hypothetical protein [bacterium]
MTAYPPSAAVRVRIAGHELDAYNGAFARGGRVVGPLMPFVTAVSDRIRIVGNRIVIERDGHRVLVPIAAGAPRSLDRLYVPLAPVLRDLGLDVRFGRRTLDVTLPPPVALGTPSPYPVGWPTLAPHAVFTPMVTPTPRPIWTGSPLPRRTPLPFVQASPPNPS